MNERDEARLAFVKGHDGWRVKLERYLQAKPIPSLNWKATEDRARRATPRALPIRLRRWTPSAVRSAAERASSKANASVETLTLGNRPG